MDKIIESITESLTFKLEKDGFRFALQIPDDSVGCSGSRCTNCGATAGYCEQVCKRGCGLPFIGPWGFPQFIEWQKLSLLEKQAQVEDVYCLRTNYGRFGATNVKNFPLTLDEARELLTIVGHDEVLFTGVHGISPRKLIEKILFDRWWI